MMLFCEEKGKGGVEGDMEGNETTSDYKIPSYFLSGLQIYLGNKLENFFI